jgi:branched-chain amino acid transport system substrate-binding protein
VASFLETGGSDLSRGYFTTHWDPQRNGPAHATFFEYCKTSEVSAALAYDAVLLAADAIERAGNTEPAAVRNALADTQGFRGATGLVTMTPWGDAAKPVLVKAIIDGVPRLITARTAGEDVWEDIHPAKPAGTGETGTDSAVPR